MKKLLSGVAFIAILFSAQLSNAQVYSQGNVVIDAYYGFPNLYTYVVKSLYDDNSGYVNAKISSLGPLGLNVEYLLSNKIGIGLEATYASTGAKADYYESNDGNTYNYSASFNRLRVLPRINIHFGSSDKVDPYLAIGMGYYSNNFKFKTNDPYFADNLSHKTLVPVSYRVGFGVRYFFTDHIGAMCEFGFGGALARGGLTFKF